MERIGSLDSAIFERLKSSESSRQSAEIAHRATAYAIGHLRLDPARGILAEGSRPLAIGPRVVATLAALVERGGEVCTKDDLLARVWATDDVAESNVAQSVYLLRKVFREEGLGNPIATVSRRGYRWTGEFRPMPGSLQSGRVAVAAADPPNGESEEAPEAARPVVPPAARRATPTAAPTLREQMREPHAVLRALFACAAVGLALLVGDGASRAPNPLPSAPANVALSSPANVSLHTRNVALSPHGAELYRLARYDWAFRTPAMLAKSVALFGAVTRSDPQNALGWAGLADADLMIADYERMRVSSVRYYARARRAIATALRLDSRSAAARTSRALLFDAAGHDMRGAEREFRRAIALDPAYPLAHQWYGSMLVEEGRFDLAERELHLAITLDPISPAASTWFAEAAYYDRHFTSTITYDERALEFDPTRVDALRGLGLAYEARGDLSLAIRVFSRLRRIPEAAPDASALLAEAYARAGRINDAQSALRVARHLQPHDFDTKLAVLALTDQRSVKGMLAELRSEAPRDPRLVHYMRT